MGKRGQIALYLLIGLVLIIGILLFVAIKPETDINVDSIEVQNIKNYVKNCIDISAARNLRMIANNGGNYYAPELDFRYEGSLAMVLFNKGEIFLKDKDVLAEEFNDALEFSVLPCINEFYDINEDSMSSEVIINEDNIVYELNLPVTIEKSNVEITVSNFRQEMPVRLGYFLKIAKEILMQNKYNYPGIIVEDLLDYEVNITSLYAEENVTIFQISEYNEYLKSDFIFMFASVFGESENVVNISTLEFY
ncbi:hypothetical protein ACFL1H_01670 [Nanoarchaeota archaeon]